jgi:protein O-GlcNAc transferase
MGWSGGRTTLEGLALGLPIVTVPGEFMRCRHAYGILCAAGLTATVASGEAEYIDLAVRLGQDRGLRARLAGEVRRRRASLYGDGACVEALHRVLCDAARARRGRT